RLTAGSRGRRGSSRIPRLIKPTVGEVLRSEQSASIGCAAVLTVLKRASDPNDLRKILVNGHNVVIPALAGADVATLTCRRFRCCHIGKSRSTRLRRKSAEHVRHRSPVVTILSIQDCVASIICHIKTDTIDVVPRNGCSKDLCPRVTRVVGAPDAAAPSPPRAREIRGE